MIGDGQRVAVLTVAELELALEVGAPQVVRRDACRKLRAAGSLRWAADAFDQTMPVQDSVDGALGWDPNVLVQAADQELANLARAPMGLFALKVKSASRSAAVAGWHSAPGGASGRSTPGTALLVAIEDLIAGLAGDPELPADLGLRTPGSHTLFAASIRFANSAAE